MRRRWIGLVAALAVLAFTNARALDFDPNEVYDLVEPITRVERVVRVVDARELPSAAAQILADGIRLGETQFRQPPPQALRYALGAWVASPAAQGRARELLAKETVRLTRFEFRFVQPVGGEATDALLRSLGKGKNKGKAGVARSLVTIEIELGGRPYATHHAGKLSGAPNSEATRAAFQGAVDDLVQALSGEPDAATRPGEEQKPSKKRR
jgi:hypothetical protein